jgi:restriction system protein
MKSDQKVPAHYKLMNPLLRAIRDLGGSGSVEEIYDKVADNLSLPEEILTVIHNPKTGNQTEIQYRLAWARTYFKKFGVLENSARGVWAISQKGSLIDQVDPKEVVRYVQNIGKQQRQRQAEEGIERLLMTLQMKFSLGEQRYIQS